MTSFYRISVTKQDLIDFAEMFRLILIANVRGRYFESNNDQNKFLTFLQDEVDFNIDIQAPLTFSLALMHIQNKTDGSILLTDDLMNKYETAAQIDFRSFFSATQEESKSETFQQQLQILLDIQQKLQESLADAREKSPSKDKPAPKGLMN